MLEKDVPQLEIEFVNIAYLGEMPIDAMLIIFFKDSQTEFDPNIDLFWSQYFRGIIHRSQLIKSL